MRKIKGFAKFDKQNPKTFPDKAGYYLTLVYREGDDFAFWDEFAYWNITLKKFDTKSKVFAYKFVSELLTCLELENIHNKLMKK